MSYCTPHIQYEVRTITVRSRTKVTPNFLGSQYQGKLQQIRRDRLTTIAMGACSRYHRRINSDVSAFCPRKNYVEWWIMQIDTVPTFDKHDLHQRPSIVIQISSKHTGELAFSMPCSVVMFLPIEVKPVANLQARNHHSPHLSARSEFIVFCRALCRRQRNTSRGREIAALIIVRPTKAI
jgi:hypothetical protein